MEATLVLEETQELVVVGQLVVGGTAHLVHQGTSTVGRSPSSTIVLSQKAVSNCHAAIEASAACTTIQDAGSANGTKKNGSRLAPGVEHALYPGDLLLFGYVSAMWRPGPPEEVVEAAELSAILPPWFNPNAGSSPLRGHVPKAPASGVEENTQARAPVEASWEARQAVREPEEEGMLVTPPRRRVPATPCSPGLGFTSPGEEGALAETRATSDTEVGEVERAKAAMETVVEGMETICGGGAPQDQPHLAEQPVGAPGGVVARVQEEVAKSTMAIPTKVAGLRVRRLQDLTSERIEPIPAGGAPQDSRGAPGGVVARAQEEVAESTMAIPTKVAGVRVEMRAVARVRLRKLQGLTSESVVLVGGGREDDAPPAKAPRRPSEASKTSRLPKPSSKTRAGSKTKGRYSCQEQGCHYTTGLHNGKRDLAAHGRANHGHDKLVCEEPHCGVEFGSSSGLNRHKNAVHKGDLLKCGEEGCGYRAGEKRDLANHCRAKHGHAKLVCPALGCNKKFVKKFLLSRHRKEHGV